MPTLAAGQSGGPLASRDSAYAWGWVDFSRYEAPSMCFSAVNYALDVERHDVFRHSRRVIVDVSDTTLPDRVVEIARRCGGRFTAAAVRPGELGFLFRLALLAQDDATTAAALDRLVSAPPPADTAGVALCDGAPLAFGPVADGYRAGLLCDAARAYLRVGPGRPAAAEALLGRLGTMGPAGRVARVIAAAAFVDYYAERLDLARTGEAAARVLRLAHELTPVELGSVSAAVVLAYHASLTQAWLTAPDTAAARTAVRAAVARANVGALHVAEARDDTRIRAQLHVGVSDADSLNLRTSLDGPAVPPVEAAYWFPAKPAPGPFTLVLDLGNGGLWFNMQGPPESGLIGVPQGLKGAVPQPVPLFSMDDLRRWHTRYGDALRLVLVAHLSEPDSSGLAPADEAEALRHYYLDVLQLPVTLALTTTRGVPATVVRYVDAAGRSFRARGWLSPTDLLTRRLFEVVLQRAVTGRALPASGPATGGAHP